MTSQFSHLVPAFFKTRGNVRGYDNQIVIPMFPCYPSFFINKNKIIKYSKNRYIYTYIYKS